MTLEIGANLAVLITNVVVVVLVVGLIAFLSYLMFRI